MKTFETLDATAIVAELEDLLRGLRVTLLKSIGQVDYEQKSSSYDLVTEFDKDIEALIVSKLLSVDPATPIVSEECGGDRSEQRYWLIDPIDGTIHFIRGNPFATINIALIEDNKPVIGIIYNFTTDDFFYAIKNNGAYKNGKELITTNIGTHGALVTTEINLTKQKNIDYFSRLVKLYKHLQLISSGFELTMVAEGKADARVFIDPHGKDYDFAAGVLLVQEAGGIAKNFANDEYQITDQNFVVATNMELYDSLVSL